MGHELPGMHGVYGHVSPAMRANLKAALPGRWEATVRKAMEVLRGEGLVYTIPQRGTYAR